MRSENQARGCTRVKRIVNEGSVSWRLLLGRLVGGRGIAVSLARGSCSNARATSVITLEDESDEEESKNIKAKLCKLRDK